MTEQEKARRALLGLDEEPQSTELVNVDPKNRQVQRVTVEQIILPRTELQGLLNAGITEKQADNIRQYVRHIAARSPAAVIGVKEATDYARSLLDWAKGYARQCAQVRGTDMTKAYLYIMRYI